MPRTLEGSIALIGYCNPNELVLVRASKLQRGAADRPVSLEDAEVYLGSQGNWMSPVAAPLSRDAGSLHLDLGEFSLVQRVSPSGPLFLARYPRGGRPIRPLNPSHFSFQNGHGLRVESKKRQIIFCGIQDNRVFFVTAVDGAPDSAELYEGLCGEGVATRKLVRDVWLATELGAYCSIIVGTEMFKIVGGKHRTRIPSGLPGHVRSGLWRGRQVVPLGKFRAQLHQAEGVIRFKL